MRFRWTTWLANGIGGLALAVLIWLDFTNPGFSEWTEAFDREWLPFQRTRYRGSGAIVLVALAIALAGGAVGFIIDLIRMEKRE